MGPQYNTMIPYTHKLLNFVEPVLLNQILDNIITPKWETLSDPSALKEYTDSLPVKVTDYVFLSQLQSKYPNLADTIKFLKSSKGTWPIHCDTHRQTAINIPLRNTNNTFTVFHEGGTSVDSVYAQFGNVLQEWFSNKYITYFNDSVEVYREVLDCPTVVNTSKPHGIINNGDKTRWICSWAYNGTFEQALEDFGV